LAVIPHKRWGGFAVLTRYGVPAGGFRTTSLRPFRCQADRVKALACRTRMALARYGPALVVVAKAADDTEHAELADAVVAAARTLNVPAVQRDVDATRTALLGAVRGDSQEALGKHLVSTIAPDLNAHLGRGEENRHYRRHAWNALALAAVEYERLFPGAMRTGGCPPENLPVASPL